MNGLERIIHSAVGDFPFLRIPLVYLYQRGLSIIPVKNYQSSEIFIAPGHFFGFHDKCPWSYDNKYILSHKFESMLPVKQAEKNPAQIGIFNTIEKGFSEFKRLSQTSAWNWQQGSSAQWVGKENKIIFNDISTTECVAKIVTIDGTVKNIIPFHIANITPDGETGFSYSFSRLGKAMVGYGYNFSEKLNSKELLNTSLSVVNLETGKQTELFNIADFSEQNYEASMHGAFGFFTHCNSSPESKRFSFLHRWVDKYHRLQTRMYSVDIDGNNLYRLPLEDCSHIAWFDERTILAYCTPKDKNPDYYLINDLNGKTEKLMQSFDCSDGHPQVSSGGRYVVTDTYPDRLRRQTLKTFDTESGKELILANLRIPFKYRLEKRCDFHPRWNRNNTMICFDSAHSGVRSLCVMRSPFPPCISH